MQLSDAVKYVISKIILLVVKKKPDKCPTRFEVACDDQKFTVKADRLLTDQQMDQLDVASARMLLSEWNGEEQRDHGEQLDLSPLPCAVSVKRGAKR